MKNSSPAVVQATGDLLNDLHGLVAEGEKTISDPASGHSEEGVGALRVRFANTQQRLGEIYMDARQKVVAGAHHADDAIRAKPYQSLAIAGGIGLLVGFLIGRRGR